MVFRNQKHLNGILRFLFILNQRLVSVITFRDRLSFPFPIAIKGVGFLIIRRSFV